MVHEASGFDPTSEPSIYCEVGKCRHTPTARIAITSPTLAAHIVVCDGHSGRVLAALLDALVALRQGEA